MKLNGAKFNQTSDYIEVDVDKSELAHKIYSYKCPNNVYEILAVFIFKTLEPKLYFTGSMFEADLYFGENFVKRTKRQLRPATGTFTVELLFVVDFRIYEE